MGWESAADAAIERTPKERSNMRKPVQLVAALALTTAGMVAACGGGGADRRTSTAGGDVAASRSAAPYGTVDSSARTPVAAGPATHHSKLGGAVAGAAVGHMLGGHAVAGAAAGALIQHERNKHAH
jgi:hypothetical protein